MKVEEVMTLDPICCSLDESAETAASLMSELSVGVIPITESISSYRLVGIITDRDLAMKVVAPGRDPNDVKLSEIMTYQPISCHPGDDLEEVIALMREKQIRRIPVVNACMELEGIVSAADLAINTTVNAAVKEGLFTDVSKGGDPRW